MWQVVVLRMGIGKKLLLFFAAIFIATPLVTSVCFAQAFTTSGDSSDITDIVVGRGKPGPYSLTWSQISSDSISVSVSGRTLRRDEYKIDTSSGMVSFSANLASDAIARVSYTTIPGKSKKATSGLNVPVSLDLFQGQGANLKLTGSYTQDAASGQGKSVIGLGGERKWSNSSLSSTFVLSQSESDSGNTMDRAAMKFGGGTSVGAIKFTGSYVQAGNEFAGAKEYGLAQGMKATNLGAEYSSSRMFSANAKFTRNEDIDGDNKGAYNSLNEQRFAFTPGSATKLSLVHSAAETGTSAGASSSTDTSALQLDQTFGLNTSAIARFETVTRDAAGNESETRTSSFRFVSTPSANLGLKGSFTQRYSESLGDEQAMSFGFSAKPTKQMGMDVAYGSTDNDSVGHQTSTDVKVTASPMDAVKVQAAFSSVDSSKLGATTKTNVKVQATALRVFQLEGSLSDNLDQTNQQSQRQFSLSGAPTRRTKLTAMFAQKGLNDADDVTRGATFEMTPFLNTRLSAGYKSIESGSSEMIIYDYAAAANLNSLLSISGSMRDRQIEKSDALDTTAVQVALAPRGIFQLQGSYQENPEDKTGAIQTFKSSTVGMTTKIGSIGLTTDFTSKDEYLANQLSEEKKFGLDLPMFGHGRLSTAYKLSRFQSAIDQQTRTYSLGYKHSVGSDFTLSLQGYYTQYKMNNVMQDEDECGAEASLGLKF